MVAANIEEEIEPKTPADEKQCVKPEDGKNGATGEANQVPEVVSSSDGEGFVPHRG